ncbi:MAG: hypothetical protein QNJ19_05885 [Woeseiaceae bacterium]|nr:hypothetical protein [Woeseiaceae bacterium]
MTTIKAILGASFWFILTGCQTVNGVYDQPARIVNPDAESRAALKAAVNEALGTEVMLADDALTGSSLLPIERTPTGTMDDPVREGLILDKPIRFQLVKNGEECVLINLSDGARYPLSNTDCEVE